jgi:hypothetical protein
LNGRRTENCAVNQNGLESMTYCIILSDSINGREFPYWLTDYQLLKKAFAPWSKMTFLLWKIGILF